MYETKSPLSNMPNIFIQVEVQIHNNHSTSVQDGVISRYNSAEVQDFKSSQEQQ